MCGIVGFFNTHRFIKHADEIIRNMSERLIHRGPDDVGLWTNDVLALGHRRLAIMDLSQAGHQPMSSHHQRYVIAYNGEIYNAPALKKQLEKKHAFVGHSDTEVILTLIEEYGFDEALKQLTGMFAFALWDKKERVLRLVRDRIGEKPLYYGIIHQTLVFASELKAFRAFPDFQPNIAPASVFALMQYGYIPAMQSIYEQIYKLLPGTYLTIQDSSTLTPAKPYWSLNTLHKEPMQSPFELTDEATIKQLDDQLNHIIRNQMLSDVPIGTFLSGGIDSSTVAALMQANSSQPIKTFTIGFQEKNYNEATEAKAIAKYLKTDHTELYVDAKQALSVIEALPSLYDEPFADSSAIPTYLVSRLARQSVKVSLTGDGGDELFGGYNRYRLGQSIWNKMTVLPYPLRWFIQKILLLKTPSPKIQKLASMLTANSTSALYQQLISQWLNPNDILTEPFPITERLHQIGHLSFIENMMLTDLQSYLPDDILVKVDRASMATSLETRAPFLDHTLIEWMWSLPLNMKIRGPQSKWLLRQVLAKYVPQALFTKPKMGFGIPLDAWLRGPLKAFGDELLQKESLERHGFLKSEPILRKWQEHVSGKRNWQYQLWTVLMFQAWMRG